MKEEIKEYGDCFRTSTQLKKLKITLSPVDIAEAHGISIPKNEVGFAPKTSLCFLNYVLTRIQEGDDLEEVSNLMEVKFWTKLIQREGKKRIDEIISKMLSSQSFSLEELLAIDQYAFSGEKSEELINKAIFKECSRIYDPQSSWKNKFKLIRHLKNGSEEKKIFVEMILSGEKDKVPSDNLRELLTCFSPTSEIKLYQTVVRFVISHI
jgi:hypothetical protein